MRHAEFPRIPLSFPQNHGFMCHVRHWYAVGYRKGDAMNAAQKRWLERRKKGKVYSLPLGGKLPRRYGRVTVYVDENLLTLRNGTPVEVGRRYAYVGWHPTNGEHAMVRAGKIKLAGRL